MTRWTFKQLEFCPDCGTKLMLSGRCWYCPVCGWAVC